MFKIGFVVRAGRQQGNVGVGPGRAVGLQAVHQRTVGARQALHLEGLEGLRKLPRHGQPVFQQVTQAAGRLAALAHHPPVAIGPAGQVKRGDMQVAPAHGAHTGHGAQVARVAMHQRGRQQALGQVGLRAVHISHHGFQQAHALLHTGFDVLPAGRVHHQRKQVQRPGALRALGIGVDVVGHAVVADLALQAGGAGVQLSAGAGLHIVKELAPSPREMCASSYEINSGVGGGWGLAGGFGRHGGAQLVKVPGGGHAQAGPGQHVGVGGRAVHGKGVKRGIHWPEYASAGGAGCTGLVRKPRAEPRRKNPATMPHKQGP